MTSITIIGAGSAGLFTGFMLKKLDPKLDVTIYEDHKHLKKTCSGILTENINEIIKLPENIILKKISKAKIFSPNNNFININFKSPDMIVDREKFNEHLKKLALKQGCNIIIGAKFEGLDIKNNIQINLKNKTKIINPDILIGADGALSNVAKYSGLWPEKERTFYLGIKAKLQLNEEEILFFPFIKNFAWIVPLKKNLCEIGVARKLDKSQKESLHEQFLTFLKFLEKKYNKSFVVKNIESALIPEYKKIKLHKKIKKITTNANAMNVYLVGDAALQVKATTLGGIIPNLRAAKILAESIVENKDYENALRKLNQELFMHKKARDVMNKFSDANWNQLIKDFQDKKLINILNEVSRDEPKKLAIELFKAKPSLIKYGRFLV